MTGWIKAINVATLNAPGMQRVELAGAAVLLVNTGSAIRAFAAECPHAGAPLEQGALCDGRIVCPWHKASFDVESGEWLEPPALEGLTSYPVRVEADVVFVELEPQPAVQPQRVSTESQTGQRAFPRLAIIGGGAAGAAAAATLLENDFGGEVTMFAAEPQAPYDRTCLSKFVPAGEMPPDEVPPILPESVARNARLRIEHSEVQRLDAPSRRVTLADGHQFTFDGVLIASGSIAKRPEIPGGDLGRIYTLRTVGDAGAILNALSSGERAVILGESFIGLEVASALRKRNVDVTVVAPGGVPLQRPLGARVGGLFREWHEANGVTFLRAKALRFTGVDNVETVELDDGTTLRTKAVIAGIGVRPATRFISGLDLEEDGGITVDTAMRAAPDIYAVGDIAHVLTADGKLNTARIEHWRVAQQQARIAALNMMGEHARYESVPFFWTEHYGKRLDYLGHVEHRDEPVISGKPGETRFFALYVHLGHVEAVLACGYEREMAQLSERMRKRMSIEVVREILGA